MQSNPQAGGSPLWLTVICWIVALVVLAIAAYFVKGGVQLLSLGGSPYYVIAGVVLLVTGGLLALRRPVAGYIYAAFFVLTAVWAVWESGFTFWALAARIGMFAVLGLILALLVPQFPAVRGNRAVRRGAYGAAVVLAVGLAAALYGAFTPVWLVKPGYQPAVATDYDPASEPDTWLGFGRTTSGEQFAPYDQITRENVNKLKVAWTFRTGDITGNGAESQNTPLQIGNILYPCTPKNKVFALEGDTGRELWKFDPGVTAEDAANWNRCRSLAYYEVPGLADDAPGKKRLYVTTADMRLIALDAVTGKPVEKLWRKRSGSILLSAWARSSRVSTTRPRGRCWPGAT
ncbi:hypothetical protein [Paenirhodobacter sp.]|uniref:hypothetical protein n=1 Tax=Paenirhodobacter sp. TaxID=1965326 RepID=UPI003B3E5418